MHRLFLYSLDLLKFKSDRKTRMAKLIKKLFVVKYRLPFEIFKILPIRAMYFLYFLATFCIKQKDIFLVI